jgi:hypothetical protein
MRPLVPLLLLVFLLLLVSGCGALPLGLLGGGGPNVAANVQAGKREPPDRCWVRRAYRSGPRCDTD